MKKFLILAIRLVLGATFLVSAIAKLLSPAAFGGSIESFGLLTPAFVPFFTYFIPAVELLLALALLGRVQLEKSAMVAALLLLIFIMAAASASISGAAVENCGCFGEIYRSGLGVGFFVRNGTLLLLALLLVGLQGAEITAPKRTELQPNR
jgi:uncharacterized membrane protein YphA (DoxX/SURF4 family)